MTAGTGGTKRRRIHIDRPGDVVFDALVWYEFGQRTEEICSLPSHACCTSRDGAVRAILLHGASKVVAYDANVDNYVDNCVELETGPFTSFLA